MSEKLIHSSFEDNLSELWWDWWSNSVLGTCEEMPWEEQAEWFIKEVTIALNKKEEYKNHE